MGKPWQKEMKTDCDVCGYRCLLTDKHECTYSPEGQSVEKQLTGDEMEFYSNRNMPDEYKAI